MILAVLNRFLHWMVVGLITPVLVLMMLSKGLTIETVGYAMALFSSFVVVFELPSGILSDRIGRKTVYLLSLAGFFASSAVLLFVQGFWLVSFGFALFGLARAFSSGSIESDFIDLYLTRYGQDRLHRLVTGMNVGEALGLALGALLGGYLPTLWFSAFPGQNLYTGNMLAQLAVLTVLFILTLFSHSAKSPPRHEPIGRFLSEGLAVLKGNRLITLFLAGMAVWGFCFCAIELYWQPQLKGMLISDSDLWLFGVINSGYFLAALVGSLMVGALMSNKRLSPLALIGTLRLLLGAAIVVLAFQNQVLGFSLWFVALMGFNGMINVPESTVLNGELPEAKRASFLSLASLVSQLGGIIASVAFSLVKPFTSIHVIWLITGAVFGLSSLLYFWLKPSAR